MLVTVIIAMIALVTGFAVRSSCGLAALSSTEALLTLNGTSASRSNSPAERPRDIRLPVDIFPVHYRLELRPVLNPDFRFFGEVDVVFVCKNPVRSMTLHMKDLALNESLIAFSAEEGSDAPKLLNWKEDRVRQFLIFNFKKELVPGVKYNASLKFSGKLNDELRGFYRSKYERDGTTRYFCFVQK